MIWNIIKDVRIAPFFLICSSIKTEVRFLSHLYFHRSILLQNDTNPFTSKGMYNFPHY